MAYIGKTPTVGNFQKCDAISVVNGQAAYTLQVGGSNVSPESPNHVLVSLNGILQAPTDSYTISGSTLTFASNLATGDVIDFVMLLGNVLDLGTPSDNTVTADKIVDDAISEEHLDVTAITGHTAETSAADADTILIHDDSASALKKMTRSNFLSGVGGDLTPSWNARLSSTQSFAGDTNTKINFDTELWDTDSAYDTSNKRFTVPSGEGGKYMYYITLTHTYSSDRKITLKLYKNGSGFHQSDRQTNSKGFTLVNFIDLSAGDYIEAYYYLHENPVSGVIQSGTDYSFFGGFKLLGV